MLSFKSFAVLSALAFGAATTVFAAPLTEGTNILARCGCSSVATIIDDLTVVVTPITQEFHYITASNCTVSALTPLVGQLKGALSDAVGEVNKLVGQPAEIILATVDGAAQITVIELAQLISTLVILIFTALGAVLNVASSTVVGCLTPLLCTVGEIVGALLSAIFSVTGGLLVGLSATVLGLLAEVIAIIVRLNVSMVISVVGIQV
ncbi:hypothetical protein EW026_g5800 [Hermanssonia centrifuga]|uniref:Uncharacterized protein n=2 Tax=Hermanssonia centrifuga TaxID=98765 RepID=A0A4S4KD54_9APHY|nr:hypothetical protein PHLCEN_2v8587 [Hermanssonia centrifuga]THG95946.1 hypothetical protein EW026_g5800 [Hermanssonia centrifuga]